MLKKESVKLFLASRQSLGSQETHYSLNTNRGAMFGLDARIALAIFGALSVISGAALYSAIKSANMERYRQELVEIVKAIESYYLDTGERLPMYNSTVVDVTPLIVNDVNAQNWNGPYLNLSVSGTISLTKSAFYKVGGIYINASLYPASDWADDNPSCVVNDSDCTEWIKVYSGNSLGAADLYSIFTDLDKHIDNSDGPLKGNFRLTGDGTSVTRFFYKGIPRKKTS